MEAGCETERLSKSDDELKKDLLHINLHKFTKYTREYMKSFLTIILIPCTRNKPLVYGGTRTKPQSN